MSGMPCLSGWLYVTLWVHGPSARSLFLRAVWLDVVYQFLCLEVVTCVSTVIAIFLGPRQSPIWCSKASYVGHSERSPKVENKRGKKKRTKYKHNVGFEPWASSLPPSLQHLPSPKHPASDDPREKKGKKAKTISQVPVAPESMESTVTDIGKLACKLAPSWGRLRRPFFARAGVIVVI